MVLNFFLDGQTLFKSKGFPEIVEKSANFLQINVDGIPKGFSTTAYFELSWEVGSVYDKAMVDGKCVVDEYITSLPSNTSDYVDYVVSFSVAGTNSEGVRFTTNKVDLIIKDTVYTDDTENTPEIPQSQYQQFVEDIANYSANPPKIGDNGNWFTWDGVSYVDTGVSASSVGSAPAPSFKPYKNTSDILTDAALVGDGELYVLWVGGKKNLDYDIFTHYLDDGALVKCLISDGYITNVVDIGNTQPSKANGFDPVADVTYTYGIVTTTAPEQYCGITIQDGSVRVSPADESQITAEVNAQLNGEDLYNFHTPIVPKTVNYAVKTGLTKNHLTFTEEEKAAARTLIGAGTQKVVFEDGATITVEDNTCYYAEAPISTLNVIYPQTDFICSFLFTIADEGNVTISLPQSKYIGGTPSFANGETWEVNIKEGVVVGGLVE